MSTEPTTLTITRISPRSRKTRIALDGEFARTTSIDVVRALALNDGDRLTLSTLNSAIDDSEPRAALDRAFVILGYHERSVFQMRNALEDDGYGETAVESAVARLIDLELLDDARFASAYVRTKFRAGWGRRRISQGLLQAGIADELAHSVLEEESPADGQRDRARELIRPFDRDDPKACEKAIRRLVSRGFTWEDARAAVIESAHDDPGDC